MNNLFSVYLDLITRGYFTGGIKNKICSVGKFQFNFTHSLTLKQKQGTRFWIEGRSGVNQRELVLVIF